MRETSPDPITWRRLRAIFGDPPLVQHVTQRQFDYFDEKLQELGRTRYDQIDMGDMWFYLFEAWTPDAGGGGPYLWENDSYVYDRGWPPENVEFLRAHVTSERVAQAVRDAAAALRHEPEGDLAVRIAAELDERLELIASRVAELPSHLASSGTRGWQI